MAERQFGPYKLIRQVAVGGMAEIHLAKTAGIAGFEKYVAIKMIHPNFAEDEQFIQMLVDEAKIAVQLSHGNIAQTFDLGRVGDTYYITMEYVDGADLYKLLRRASEQDLEMPLDVCAFVGKEISSALDHAHRKRDHAGKPLGIVHRDVSPQNVLVSYSGEVKLVDFGIAKATMKARQTAVGVIKGKYYYMSPEQAWGDPIDHRSDIFSAGIVLYEMITGQMLYLEEDLHKLLEMARAADIAPPSKLRRGVPPQLERIVMHALAKKPADRYQTASDFAIDLERFLHSYSPVFTASKLSTLMRKVVGEPTQVPDEDPAFQHIEFRDGVMSTHPLDDSEVAHAVDHERLRDENSVIFRVSDLDRQRTNPNASAAPPPPPRASTAPIGSGGSHPREARPTAPAKPVRPATPAPKVTRATDSVPPVRPSSPDAGPMKIPSIAARPGVAAKPPAQAKPAAQAKPRQAHEETRELQKAPPNPLHDDTSGLLTPEGQKLWPSDAGDLDDELDNIGERTLITAAPGSGAGGVSGLLNLGSFMVDGDAADDGDGPVEATLVTMVPGFGGAPAAPEAAADDEEDVLEDAEPVEEDDDESQQGDDAPTLSNGRAIAIDKPAAAAPRTQRKAKAPPPAALAAKIHAPAISELRKPRPSRRTPPGGVPVAQPSVLQAIVSSQASEPMPAPRPSSSSVAPLPPPPAAGMDPAYAAGTPQAQPAYHADASGLPLAMPTPPAGVPAAPGVPSHLQPYLHMQGIPPGGFDPNAPQVGHYPGQINPVTGQMNPNPGQMHPLAGQVNPVTGQMHPGQMHPGQMHQGQMHQGQMHGTGQMPAMHPGAGYPQVSPSALYQFQPQQQQPMSITGQMRLYEVDELPSQYQIVKNSRRWLTYLVSGILAVSVAAAATFFIIHAMQDKAPTVGSVHIESVPANADVLYDGTRLSDKTPLTLDGAPVGTRHTIRVELPHRQPYEETIDIPRDGREVSVRAVLAPILGKVLIDSQPGGAEIRINGALRGRTPAKIGDLDPSSKIHVELRLKDYQPFIRDYEWPADATITISAPLQH